MKIGKDILWVVVWSVGVAVLGIWDLLFLNRPALMRVVEGFVNTTVVAVLVCALTLILGWLATLLLTFTETGVRRVWYIGATFVFNLIRSVPQVVGILFGYVALTFMIQEGLLRSTWIALLLMAAIVSCFIFLELVDLMRERIDHFKKRDFYSAMLVCGVPQSRIINFDILWKNSRGHVFNKLISVFGMAVFLQCSVDFIISVGLSTNISQVNLPTTLGSMLARIDSKQDILAIGHTLTHPSYASNLFLGHLQGISVAFLIVFTLVCIHNLSNAFARRHRL